MEEKNFKKLWWFIGRLITTTRLKKLGRFGVKWVRKVFEYGIRRPHDSVYLKYLLSYKRIKTLKYV